MQDNNDRDSLIRIEKEKLLVLDNPIPKSQLSSQTNNEQPWIAQFVSVIELTKQCTKSNGDDLG